jgi:TatD DNase family protein
MSPMAEPCEPLIDIGVNLTHRQFAADLPQVIERARRAGVVHQVVTGTSIAGSRAAVHLARAHPGELSATVGIHPHGAARFDESSGSVLRDLASEKDPQGRALVVAIGECGLDYDRDFSPRAAQRRCFEAQLTLARELGQPVFLHERAAHADFLAMLREHRRGLPGAVVHCFTGGEDELMRYLELDCQIGITGFIADERRAGPLCRAAPQIPLGRLMIETDAPFLLPRGEHGRRNEPGLLPLVLDAVARATGRERLGVARATTENARRFFRLG